MQVLDALGRLPARWPVRTALAWGVFDGVHRGHREILAAVREEARRVEGESLLLSFATHPAEALFGRKVPLLTTLGQRLRLLAEAGIDAAVAVPFDRAFSEIPAEGFLKDLLCRKLSAAAIVIGPDTRFGRDRTGDEAMLRAGAAEGGYAVRVVQPLLDGGERVSSTRIRQAVAAGKVEEAARLLGGGRFFAYEGKVEKGDGRGRAIGFPTANLADSCQCVPAPGVYAGRAVLSGTPWPAAVNVGVRPTFSGGAAAPSIEAHLIGFAGDLYGKMIEVEFLSPIRSERRFASPKELSGQIAKDVAEAKAVYSRICGS